MKLVNNRILTCNPNIRQVDFLKNSHPHAGHNHIYYSHFPEYLYWKGIYVVCKVRGWLRTTNND